MYLFFIVIKWICHSFAIRDVSKVCPCVNDNRGLDWPPNYHSCDGRRDTRPEVNSELVRQEGWERRGDKQNREEEDGTADESRRFRGLKSKGASREKKKRRKMGILCTWHDKRGLRKVEGWSRKIIKKRGTSIKTTGSSKFLNHTLAVIPLYTKIHTQKVL